MKKKLLAILLAAAMLAALLAGCGGGSGGGGGGGASGGETPSGGASEQTPASPSGGGLTVNEGQSTVSTDELAEKKTPADTLVVGTVFEPTSLQTWEVLATSTLETNPVYEPLMTKNWETGELEPCLATSWEFEDDRTLRIKLRDDVYFHSGDHLTTADVVYTLDKLINSSRWGAQYNPIDLDACEIVSDYEMTIVTSDPYGPLLGYLGNPTAGILCERWSEEKGDDALVTEMNGTGPFIQGTWTQGAKMTYTRNEEYWGTKPEFKNLEICFYTDATVMFIDYETGALDVAMCVSDTDAQRVLNGEVSASNITLNPACQYWLCFWDQGEHFSNPLVRQAVAHAVDTAALTKLGFGILGEQSQSAVAPYCAYYTPIATYEYNPEKAKELLAEAGYPDGFDILLIHNTETLMKNMAEGIQAMLSQVGINITLESYETSVQNALQRGTETNGIPYSEWQMYGVTPSTGDPDQLFVSFKSTSAYTSIRNSDPKFLELVEGAAKTVDAEERAQMYADFQQHVYDNVNMIPIACSTRAYVYRNYIDYLDSYAPYVMNFALTTFK